MIQFIILSLIFWLGVAGFTFMLWVSIQPGNWAEKWQNRLRNWDLEGKEFLYRVMGGCQVCFSHAIAQVSFIFFITLMLATDLWSLNIIGSIIWYGLYISISTCLNLFFITKLFK